MSSRKRTDAKMSCMSRLVRMRRAMSALRRKGPSLIDTSGIEKNWDLAEHIAGECEVGELGMGRKTEAMRKKTRRLVTKIF